MSCYEWERGTIIIPTGAYPKLRRQLVTAWNDLQKAKLARAIEIRTRVLAEGKGKRGFDYVAAITKACESRRLDTYGYPIDSDEGPEEILKLLGMADRRPYRWNQQLPPFEAPSRPLAPKVKDLDLRPISKGGTFNLDEAAVGLDDANHAIVWSVSENNRACERARSLPFAVEVFRALGKIEWTRGSGGKIIGNDEYNRHSDGGEGSGGNYCTASYGPLGGQPKGRRQLVPKGHKLTMWGSRAKEKTP